MDFGDYVLIEMKRHGAPNEFYLHKVIRTMQSNAYCPVPAQFPYEQTIHKKVVEVVCCICCGIAQDKVIQYRVEDVKLQSKKKYELAISPSGDTIMLNGVSYTRSDLVEQQILEAVKINTDSLVARIEDLSYRLQKVN